MVLSREITLTSSIVGLDRFPQTQIASSIKFSVNFKLILEIFYVFCLTIMKLGRLHGLEAT